VSEAGEVAFAVLQPLQGACHPQVQEVTVRRRPQLGAKQTVQVESGAASLFTDGFDRQAASQVAGNEFPCAQDGEPRLGRLDGRRVVERAFQGLGQPVHAAVASRKAAAAHHQLEHLMHRHQPGTRGRPRVRVGADGKDHMLALFLVLQLVGLPKANVKGRQRVDEQELVVASPLHFAHAGKHAAPVRRLVHRTPSPFAGTGHPLDPEQPVSRQERSLNRHAPS
jgi:hypothetical protein